MSTLDAVLATVASKQRMLVTLEDVRRAGGGSHHVQRRVEGGRWTPVDRGVYLIAGAPLDWTTRQLATVLAAGDGALSSHLAAGRLLNLPGFARAGHELSIPRGRRYRRHGVRTHESTDLDRCSTIWRDGVPLTDPDRTMLDLARYLGIQRMRRVVESARRQELVTWSSLARTLVRHARRGRHGTRRLRAVILADAHRQEITDSDFELIVLSLLLDAGLPEPELHHQIYEGDRFIAEVDLAYPRWRIAVECDGPSHLEEATRERDLPRQNDLVLAGWTVLRFSWKRVRERPGAVIAEVRDAIEAARSAPAA